MSYNSVWIARNKEESKSKTYYSGNYKIESWSILEIRIWHIPDYRKGFNCGGVVSTTKVKKQNIVIVDIKTLFYFLTSVANLAKKVLTLFFFLNSNSEFERIQVFLYYLETFFLGRDWFS